MKPYKIVLVNILILSCLSCDNILNDSHLIITNVTLIDSQNGIRDNMTVYIKDNTITKIAANTNFRKTKNTQVIDGTDKYLIPGLWDTHVHLTYNKELTPVMFDLFMLHGVTSVRDTGGELNLVAALKGEANKDPKNKPRVTITGPLLDGIPTVYNGKGNTPKLGKGIATLEAARKQMTLLKKAEVDAIKLYEMLSPANFHALLKMADSLNIPVTGHVPLSLDAINASNAGMRSMEHLRNLEFAFSKNWDSLLHKRRKLLLNDEKKTGMLLRAYIHKAQRTYAFNHVDTLRKKQTFSILKSNDTWQVPTLTIMTVASLQFFGSDEWKSTFELLPNKTEDAWLRRLNYFLKRPKNEENVHHADWMFKTTKELNDAGVKLMAGTDTPIFFLTPGYSLHEELALLVKSGLSPMEALDAATFQPAAYFKIDDKLGSIDENKIADLLLLNANPLENIRNTTRIEAVIKDGKLHDRKALDSLKTTLKNN